MGVLACFFGVLRGFGGFLFSGWGRAFIPSIYFFLYPVSYTQYFYIRLEKEPECLKSSLVFPPPIPAGLIRALICKPGLRMSVG